MGSKALIATKRARRKRDVVREEIQDLENKILRLKEEDLNLTRELHAAQAVWRAELEKRYKKV